MVNSEAFVLEFIEQAVFRLRENTEKIERCLAEYSEKELWKRPNEASNSMGNQLLHLSGNIRQYIHFGIAGQSDIRQRDSEFSTNEGYDKATLMANLKHTIEEAIGIIEQQNVARLLQKSTVQSFELTGLANILHVVEHYSYHSGQIAFWTKILKSKDLGFYAGLDL